MRRRRTNKTFAFLGVHLRTKCFIFLIFNHVLWGYLRLKPKLISLNGVATLLNRNDNSINMRFAFCFQHHFYFCFTNINFVH